ncbi:hypothetical protein CGRA01v4_01079 [Colletotrichum graminicola]|uniref:Uncharacterized protein n=1 Tax=Colletotrichum graminicola (strain M1.001 / M2 / FGSC 10212) TaxID=645133 RepID=E3QGP8_COLGM|nr:uncharacterized protein GLRG_05180 [Colletotrichum graminicola M1.001]EFQ30036.1 hypothetical protein GLRG_05180 [Colletotrichum graminicola M1.001]WDK09801.1 hypothetical protein CGRA01v4_01079 [Colletotrichum graminicola]
MAPNTWTDTAEKDLIWTFIKVSNGGKIPKANWVAIHQEMTGMGYQFTIPALNQHWSKTIVKNYGKRVEGVAAGNAATPDLASAPSTPSTSRKRAAPGSGARVPGARGRRGNQAAHDMASGADAVDDGQDDDEFELEDIKPKMKRTKIFNHGAAVGLNGQQIDLTNDTENVQASQRLEGLSIMDGVKVEGDDGYFGRGRDRSMTAAPAGHFATDFNAFASNAGPSQHRKLGDSI